VTRDVGVERCHRDPVHTQGLLRLVERDDAQRLRTGVGEPHGDVVADLQAGLLRFIGLNRQGVRTDGVNVARDRTEVDGLLDVSRVERGDVFRRALDRRARNRSAVTEPVSGARRSAASPPGSSRHAELRLDDPVAAHCRVDRELTDERADDANTVMNATSATPIIRAEAVADVRRGLRIAFSLASVPAIPACGGAAGRALS